MQNVRKTGVWLAAALVLLSGFVGTGSVLAKPPHSVVLTSIAMVSASSGWGTTRSAVVTTSMVAELGTAR